jgi:hypothetical protein
VTVAEDEDIGGEVVAVLGSVRINGQARQVVAVLGSIDLGPRAVVLGDVVAVGGRVRQDPGARVSGGVTDVGFDGPGVLVHLPWLGEIRPINLFGPFGAVPRLIASVFRFMLLALLACIALVIARATVERSAERLSENPFKALLVGFATELLFLPVLILVSILLAITIIGIPVAVVLVPLAVLVLLLVALAGFSGTAHGRTLGASAVRMGRGRRVPRCLPWCSRDPPAGPGRSGDRACRLARLSDRVPLFVPRRARRVPGVGHRSGRRGDQRVDALAGRTRRGVNDHYLV